MTRTETALDAIEVFDQPVGVLVSGGADSALLLYLLLSKYKSKVHVFTVAVGTSEQVDVKASVDVVTACVRLTGNDNVEHHISFIPKEPTKRKPLRKLPQEYLDNNVICKLFHGITKSPPAEVLEQWGYSLLDDTAEERDPATERTTHRSNHLITPWTNLDKKDLAELYRKYDLIDTLFCYTKSCIDAEPKGERYHCGDCWWCLERKWAFGTL